MEQREWDIFVVGVLTGISLLCLMGLILFFILVLMGLF